MVIDSANSSLFELAEKKTAYANGQLSSVYSVRLRYALPVAVKIILQIFKTVFLKNNAYYKTTN
jgi:hypothetical protein